MFFDDLQLTKRTRVQLAELPRTPETNWRPPKDYPNWQYACAVGFDFEVKENDFDHGPGWSRNQASICGGSIDLLFPDGTTYTEYRPIRHEVDGHLNLPVPNTIKYWKDVLESPIPKFGANLIYDVGNATDEGIWVQGELYDCQFAEALLTQDDPVALEYIGQKYLKQSKETNMLYEWCAKAYGGEPTQKQRSNIFRTSPKLAGPYGEQDARMPRPIVVAQMQLLRAQGLWDLFRMECDLIPLWVIMRKLGCRVDIAQAERMKIRLTKEIVRCERKIFDLTGKWLNVFSADELGPIYASLNIETPITPKTEKPSIRADWLLDQNDDFSELVLETRQYYKLRDTFVQSYILDAHVNGYIHGQFHPLRNEGSRGETGGTSTGRLSSSTPNLQNIPSRTPLGREIMKMFLPDEGHKCCESGDYSQIEYRTFMHYAVGPKADEFRQKYIQDKKTDYHNMAQTAIKNETGIYIPRKAAEVAAGNFATGRMTIKEANFAKLFGVGKRKMSAMAHCAVEQGDKILKALGVALPFIETSQKEFIKEAKVFGFITTVLNRRYRFDLWEAVSEWDEETQAYKRTVGLPYHAAIRAYGRVQRAGTHKSMAGRCQGSAADVLKFAFWTCLKSGVFTVMGYPKLSVHDQVLRSVQDHSPRQVEAANFYHYQMENSLPLRVPKLFEVAEGSDWGSIE